MTQGRWFVMLGAISAALAVLAGAFGAHGLREIVSPDALRVFRTAGDYHLIHSVALCVIGVWLEVLNGATPGSADRRISGYRWLRRAGWTMLLGIVCFSGSLYLLALGGPGWLGPLTPIGGLCFIFGWLALAGAALAR